MTLVICGGVLLFFVREGYLIGREGVCDYYGHPIREYCIRLILTIVAMSAIFGTGFYLGMMDSWRQVLPAVYCVGAFEISMLFGLIKAILRFKKL